MKSKRVPLVCLIAIITCIAAFAEKGTKTVSVEMIILPESWESILGLPLDNESNNAEKSISECLVDLEKEIRRANPEFKLKIFIPPHLATIKVKQVEATENGGHVNRLGAQSGVRRVRLTEGLKYFFQIYGHDVVDTKYGLIVVPK